MLPSNFSNKIKSRVISEDREYSHPWVNQFSLRKTALCRIEPEINPLNRILLDGFYSNGKQSKCSLLNYQFKKINKNIGEQSLYEMWHCRTFYNLLNKTPQF